MASKPIIDPVIPHVSPVEGIYPGKMVKIRGKVPPEAIRFAVNYQLGPNLNPRDDIAIHVSPRFPEGFITRNHIESMSWGPEENMGPMVIQPGQDFEMFLLCERHCFKIAINGRHFAEFVHRLPYHKITHLVIDGDVIVHNIDYEIIPVDQNPDIPPVAVGPPAPGGLYPTLGGPQPGYGPPPNYGPGYNPPPAYGQQHEKPEEEDVFGGCLNKVGVALGGLVAAGGVAAAMHAMNKKKDDKEKDHEKSDASHTESEGGLGGLGALGTALASSLAANALQGNRQQSGYPSQESGGVLGSILGALGNGGQQPAYPAQKPADPLGGTLGSILGGVLGGGNQPPAYQPSGGYGGHQQPGYPGYPPQSSGGSDLLSGIGGAIGSSLLSSAFEGLTKHKSHDSHPSSPRPEYSAPSQPTPRSQAPPSTPSGGGGGGDGKLSAAEISKGLGLGDDED